MLKAWRFATLLLVAIGFSTALAHLLELPAKMEYEPTLYVLLHRTLYWNYGRIGGPAEVFGLLLAIGLVLRLWRVHLPFVLAAIGAALLATAFVVFLAFVHPANGAMLAWSLESLPSDWTHWRDRWEYGHAARALLMLGGFAALLASALQEPASRRG
jgi:hypothetical protein